MLIKCKVTTKQKHMKEFHSEHSTSTKPFLFNLNIRPFGLGQSMGSMSGPILTLGCILYRLVSSVSSPASM